MSDVRKLAKIVADHSRQIKGLSGGPQAAYSSIEGGSMDAYDNDGKMRLRIGAQDDGTHAVKYVQGPPPPRPTAPVVSVDGPVVRVRWDGVLLGGHIPEDFARIDVHFALASDDLEAEGAVRGNLATSAGNETVLAATSTGTYRVGLVAMSQSRARSEMSETVDVEVELVNLKGAIDTAVDNASGGSNHYRPAPPEGADHTENDLWFDTSVDPETGLTAYTPHRWDDAAQGWVSVGDQRTAAIQDAQDALRVDVDQIITDGSGTTTYWLPTEPDETTEPTPKTGDIWFNTADGNKLHRFDGQGWVSASDSRFQTIQDAQDALESDIDAVRTSANGKNAVHWSTSTPPSVYDGVVDDTWFRMSSMGSGGRVVSQWRWNGTVWVSTVVDNAVIANLDAGKITSGFIDAERFEAGSIAASSIAVGDFSNLATIDPIRDVNVTRPSSWATETVDGYITPKATSQNYLMFKDRTDTVPFKGGDRLRIEFKAVAEVDADAAIRLWGYPDPADGSTSGVTGVTGDHVRIGTTEQSFTTYVTIPDTFGVEKTLRSWIFGLGPAAGSDLHQAGVREVTAYRMTGATLIEDGAITTDKIATGAITAESGIIASLNAGTITVGEMSGARIEAGTVTADKLLVSDGVELAPSPAQYPDEWLFQGGAHIFDWVVSYDGKGVRLQGSSPAAFGPFRATAPGEKWWGEAYAGRYSGATADAQIRIYFYDANRSYMSSTLADSGIGSLGGVATAPAGAVFARLGLYFSGELGNGWLSIRDIHGRRQASATLIEDGAITTRHIETGSITAESGIIGSLDAGVINVGEMNGARIEAGTVDTPQLAFGAATGDVLSVDALNFKTAVGLDIRGSSFRAGDAVEMTEDFGIRQFGPDGALNVSLPSDGSPAEFRGDLSARTLTATGRMSIQGPGAIASGGVLELESGVVPPVAGPQITNTWDRLELPQVEDNEAPVGIAWAEGHWWRAVSVTGASSSNDTRARVEKLTPTGDLVSSFPTAFGSGFNGLTLHEGLLYTLGAVVGGAVGNRWVVAYNLDGTESHRWEYTSYGTGTYQPGIGVIGPNIAIAQCWASGDLSWRIYRPSDGYQIQRVDRDGRVASDIVGIHLGQFDLDSQKIIVGASRPTASSVQLLAYSHSGTPEFESGYSWYAAGYEAIRGFAWDGSRFWTLQPDGHLAAYQPLESGRFVGDNDSDWWCAIAWAADGGQETPAGPATNFRYLRRSRLRRQNGDVPEGVEAAAVFYAKTETEPARADLHWGGSNSSPDLVNHADYISASWQAARTPSAENTFTTDAPGEIHSALGNFRVDGTGAGEWGPLAFHADGTMTDSSRRIASGQISVDATANVTMITTVTFPAGRFTREPIMLVTPRTDAMSQTPLVGAWNVTAESAQIAFRRSNAVTTLINWLAIEQEG